MTDELSLGIISGRYCLGVDWCYVTVPILSIGLKLPHFGGALGILFIVCPGFVECTMGARIQYTVLKELTLSLSRSCCLSILISMLSIS